MKARINFLAVLATLAVAVSAQADDRKVYHGSQCEGVHQPVPSFEATESWTEGIKCVAANSECHISCPMIRDRVNDQDTFAGTDGLNIEVFNSASNNIGVGCGVSMIGEDGAGGTVLESIFDSTTGAGNQELIDFNGMDASTGDEGSYFMNCYLGTNDIVRSYRVIEDSDAGGID